MINNEAFNKHYVAVIGGSISGSEAAYLLAEKGFMVVVFDMNKLPYGKIEDGLPNWHIKLRDRQINEIDSKIPKLVSEIEQKLFRIANNRSELVEFIDLSIYDEIGNCISYLHVSKDGSSAIIDDCNNTISTFNRLGRLNKTYHLSEYKASFVYKSNSSWNYITSDNIISNLNNGDFIDLAIDQDILDVSIKNNLLYILSTDKIWVVNAIVE